MPDIFGRVDQLFGGGLSADAMFMSFPGIAQQGDGVGLLIQNVGVQYTQPVRRIFELGPGINGQQLTYYIVGRPEGNFTMARIFGFTAIAQSFYSTYGDPCNQSPEIDLSANIGCSEGGNEASVTWTLSGVLLNNITMNATAQEMIIQEGISGMFIELTLNETGNEVAPEAAANNFNAVNLAPVGLAGVPGGAGGGGDF